MSEQTKTKQISKTSRPKTHGPDRKVLRRALGLYLGIMVVCVALSLVAFTPANRRDQRPRILAALVTATSTKTPTPTRTPTPTVTPTPTITLTPTVTLTPSLTPTSTPSNTPTPQPTPDSQDREVYAPILMYHYISNPPPDADAYRKDLSVSPDNFRAQMQWLKDNGYQALTLDRLVYVLSIGKPSLPPKTVFLTFDDGYVDNYEIAFPILKEMGFQGTFFILTTFADRNQPGYLTWDQIKKMNDAGMSIQVHGKEHLEAKGRDAGWLNDNLGGAAKAIQDHLGYQPRFLAYPAGAYDDMTISAASQLGFWAAATVKYGSHQEKSRMYELERMRISGDMSIQVFSAAIAGAGPQ